MLASVFIFLVASIISILIKKKSSPQESTDQFNKQPVSDKQIVLSVFFSLLSMIFLSGLVLNFYITTGLVDIGGDVGAQLAALAYALILTYSLFVPFWFVYEEI